MVGNGGWGSIDYTELAVISLTFFKVELTENRCSIFHQNYVISVMPECMGFLPGNSHKKL